jgi:phosphate starvation-inducible PhoH-like protein
MFLFHPALFLLSSFGITTSFYSKPMYQTSRLQSVFFRTGVDIFKNGILINQMASKRRKDIEDIVVDGLLDTTKKILSIDEKKRIKTFHPKTENQRNFVELMRNDKVDIIVAIGPAGTGKTMLACYAAVEALRLKKVNKIVVTRPVVSVDEELGFLPGSLESKMDPWTRPIFDTLRETFSAKEIEKMMEESIIEIVPLGFMRGRTFKNAWIIADEMQNSSPTQMFMLATRIGEGSKMIITGDLNQSDLNPNKNGLLEIYHKVRMTERQNGLDYVQYIELDKEDVQRSRAAKIILGIYESANNAFATVNEVSAEQRVRGLSGDDLSSKDNRNTQNSRPFEYEESGVVVPSPSPSIIETEVEVEEESIPEIDPNRDLEWVDLSSPKDKNPRTVNDDAALIPLKHMKKPKSS